MSAKSAVLAAAALAVAVLAVYLFIQVRSTPAQASATVEPRPAPPPEPARAAETAPPRATPPPLQRPARTDDVAARRPVPQMGTEVGGPPELTPADERRPNIKKDNLMELANKAYDRQDFDQAIALASKVLAVDPTNVRMLRVMVSANCIAGDSAVAQEHYERLPGFDRDQMRTRCDRYGVVFKEPAR